MRSTVILKSAMIIGNKRYNILGKKSRVTDFHQAWAGGGGADTDLAIFLGHDSSRRSTDSDDDELMLNVLRCQLTY